MFDRNFGRTKDRALLRGQRGLVVDRRWSALTESRSLSTSRVGGNDWEPLTKGLPQENCYVNILRDAMSSDTLDPCGIYFGTTGGQVYCSADSGDSWMPIVHDLPAVLSVEAQTLA